MGTFIIGDYVRVVVTQHHEDYGAVGYINEMGEGFLPYRVYVPGMSHKGYWHKPDDLKLATKAEYEEFNADELAPADEPPEQAGEASEPYTQYLVDRQRVWDSGHAATDFQTWRIGNLEDQLVSSQALAATNASLLANAQSELMVLEGERNRLRAQLAAVTGALEPFGKLYGDWLINRQEIEFLDYLNRYRVSDELLADVMNASVVIQTVSNGEQASKQADGEG